MPGKSGSWGTKVHIGDDEVRKPVVMLDAISVVTISSCGCDVWILLTADPEMLSGATSSDLDNPDRHGSNGIVILPGNHRIHDKDHTSRCPKIAENEDAYAARDVEDMRLYGWARSRLQSSFILLSSVLIKRSV